MKTAKPTINVVWREDKNCMYYIVVRYKGKAQWHSTGVKGTTKTGWRRIPEVLDQLERTEAVLKDFRNVDGATLHLWQEKRPEGVFNPLGEALRLLSADRNLALHTVKNYQRAIDLYTMKFGRKIATVDEAKGWLKELRGTFQNSSILSYAICLKSLFAFGVRQGILKSNPFNFEFGREGYKVKNQPRARTMEEVDKLWDYFDKGNIWAGIWLAGYTFCGLAMVDLLRLDFANLEVQNIDWQHYYVFTIERKKTNQTVKGVVKVNDQSERLRELMIEVQGWHKSIEFMNEKVNRQLGYLGFTPKLTYYSARHTYATQLINTRAPLNVIASLLGRNVRQIETYIQQVNSNRTLAQAVSLLSPLE